MVNKMKAEEMFKKLGYKKYRKIAKEKYISYCKKAEDDTYIEIGKVKHFFWTRDGEDIAISMSAYTKDGGLGYAQSCENDKEDILELVDNNIKLYEAIAKQIKELENEN